MAVGRCLKEVVLDTLPPEFQTLVGVPGFMCAQVVWAGMFKCQPTQLKQAVDVEPAEFRKQGVTQGTRAGETWPALKRLRKR